MKPVLILYYGALLPVFVLPEQAAAAITQGLASECWIVPCPSPRYFCFLIRAWLKRFYEAVTRRKRLLLRFQGTARETGMTAYLSCCERTHLYLVKVCSALNNNLLPSGNTRQEIVRGVLP